MALGACASIGGVNCIKNFLEESVCRDVVYGDKARWFSTYPARPLRAVVPVDLEIHGCPVDRKEFLRVVKELLTGKAPWQPDYPVCMECKQAGNICNFERGRACLGSSPGGCGAAASPRARLLGLPGTGPHANLDAART